MNTKLTLSLDKDIIERAKIYAKENNISLSFLIENYLVLLISDFRAEEPEKGSIVNELSGVIDLPKEFDYKDLHTDYLIEKYK